MTRFDRIVISAITAAIFILPAIICLSYGNH